MVARNFDLKKLSVSFTGIFGTFTVLNYGDGAASIKLTTPQKEANTVEVGAAGDTLTKKRYDVTTHVLSVSVLKDAADDFRFKNIVALVKAGNDVIMTISYNDENIGERYITLNGTLKEVPDFERGTEMTKNQEYVFNMPEALYTPPSLSV